MVVFLGDDCAVALRKGVKPAVFSSGLFLDVFGFIRLELGKELGIANPEDFLSRVHNHADPLW